MSEGSQRSGLPYLWLSGLVIVLDQLTKWIATNELVYRESVPVFPGLNWTLLHNYGAAFSFLNQSDGWQRWPFVILGLIITIVLLVWLKRTPKQDWRTALPLAFIIGGALGNIIDRIYLGYVVDFIDVYYKTAHWPAFNIADSAIFVGAALLIIFSFQTDEQASKEKT